MQLNSTTRAPSSGALVLSPRVALLSAVLSAVLAGCASDTSFDRHNLSRLWRSPDGQQLFFDASVSHTYPEDDPEAEQARRGWIAEWLKLRKYCTEGHNVTGRRSIRPDEYNPMRHHLRYEITCAQVEE